MKKVRQYKPPQKDWKYFYQFLGLGVLTSALIGYAFFAWLAPILFCAFLIAAHLVVKHHYKIQVKSAHQTYFTYLIEFDSSVLIEATQSTLLDIQSKTLISEFLKAYRPTDIKHKQ